MQNRIKSPCSASDVPSSISLDHSDAHAWPSGYVGPGVQAMAATSDHRRVDGSTTGLRDTVAAGTETKGTSGSNVSLPPWLRSKGFSEEEKEKVVRSLKRPGRAVVR